MQKPLLVFFFLLSTSIITMGQLTPGQLMTDRLENEIIKSTTDFDSLICIDVAGYWHDEERVIGFGYAKGEVYSIAIPFKKDTAYNLSVKRVAKKRVYDQSKLDSLKNINYLQVLNFNNDSLNISTRQPNAQAIISDISSWTIICIYPNKNRYLIRQVYGLSYFQFTNEQNVMKKTIEQLSDLLGEKL